MALEIQLLLQGNARIDVENDLVEGEDGFNNDVDFLELIYHVKGSPGTYRHFPTEEKLAQLVKANKTGGQFIGISAENMQTLTQGTSQSVFEQIDAQLAVLGSSAVTFLDQFESDGGSDIMGPNAGWADTGGWVSTVDNEFTFTDSGGDGLTIDGDPNAGALGFYTANAWYGITYTATNGGTPTTATLQMEADSGGDTFNMPTTNGLHTVFFRSETSFRVKAIESSAGAGSIVLSNVSIARANFSDTASTRPNTINGDTSISGFNIDFINKESGARFVIQREIGNDMSLESEHFGADPSAGQDTLAIVWNQRNTNLAGGFTNSGRMSHRANENWTASAKGSAFVWDIIQDGQTSKSNKLALTGTNLGELQLLNGTKLKFSTNRVAIAAETLSHYVLAVDNAGTVLKLAVIT